MGDVHLEQLYVTCSFIHQTGVNEVVMYNNLLGFTVIENLIFVSHCTPVCPYTHQLTDHHKPSSHVCVKPDQLVRIKAGSTSSN